MSKLDPKPEYQKPKYSWDDLNAFLQSYFSGFQSMPPTIDVRNYTMSKEEIIREATAQGYKVFEQGEHLLRFE